MTTTAPSPRLLLLSTVLLTVAGVALLGVPHAQEQPAPSPTAHSAADPPSAAAVPHARKPTAGVAVSATSVPSTPSTSSAVVSALPPHGEGVAGDLAIQQSLEAAWPADLPAHDERQLLRAARALLRADATGIGRATWPEVFPDSGKAVAPAFAVARFRIQAAIARRDSRADRAVVHLVWAGMDRGGTFTDLRVTDWFFTRTFQKGAAAWTVQPRT
ncbi:hypothetical protein ACFVOK_18860 [Streptomyces sp. NPDC057798]|uniref:hypothetical protein n=1 Tax=Streptomyces sp. NPDC057798 TaxID=3346252 RepID=UPI0036D0AF9D